MRFRHLFVAGFLAAAITPAHADPFWLYDGNAATPVTFGQFYISANANGGVQQLPRFNSTVSVFQGSSIVPTAIDPEVWGAEPGGAIGYVFRDGTLPPWIGQRVRMEFSGNYLSLTSRDSRSFQTIAGQTVVINGVGGTAIFAPTALGQSFRYDDELRVERDGFRLRLKFAADHAFSPSLSLTPSIAVHGGQLSDSYDYRYVFVVPAGTAGAPGRITERLRTNEIGLDLGGALNWQFMPGWALNAAGTVGVVWQRTRLTGQDCFNNATGLPLSAECGPSNVAFSSTSISDSRSATGFRGTAMLGLSADMRFAVASIGGFFRYDSRIPGIENPQSQTAANITSGARVRFQDGFAYGGYFTFRVPLAFGL